MGLKLFLSELLNPPVMHTCEDLQYNEINGGQRLLVDAASIFALTI